MKVFSLLAVTTATLFSSASALATRCAETDARHWQNQAEELISTRHYRIRSNSPQLAAQELAVVQNAFISAAYARLFQNERMNTSDSSPNYTWLAAAAFASFKVGQMIRHGYYAVAEDRGVDYGFRPPVYSANPVNAMILGDQTITEEQVADRLITGNRAIYRDMYWQHLAAIECGIDTVIRIVSNKKRTSTNSSEISHYDQLENGWRLIKTGRVDQGNTALLGVEQNIVLQPLIYDGVLSRIFGRVFARLATIPIQDPNYSFPSFVDFCRQHRLTPNISNPDSRWRWISEQMGVIGQFVRNHQDSLSDHHNQIINDSHRIVGFLNDPSIRFLPARFGN